jgi:DNA-binding NarL/FixJ family response regulator
MGENRSIDPAKLLLVDDHPIIAYGLRALLEHSSDFVLEHISTCNQEAITVATDERPDIIILDLQLPGRNGIEAIPELRKCCPNCKIVVFSSLQESLYAVRALKAGAQAYVHKEAGMAQLLEALCTVRDGKIFVSETVQQDILHFHSGGKVAVDDLSVLSNQELNVLRLIGNGLRLSDIAAELGISPKTVGTHRERIKNKLTLHSGKELDQFAMARFSALPKTSVQQ